MYHSSFKINSKQFNSIKELLTYTKNIDLSVYNFLKNWFDDNNTIDVKTSGSTGKPKIIAIKKEFMLNSAKATAKFFNLYENTTALMCLSANYIAGKMMLVRAMALGWHLDIISPSSKITIDKNYDFSAMVPLQVRYSLSSIPKIKTLIIGGGVVPYDLLEQLQNLKTEVFATYGMTETITHIAVKKLNNCTNFERKYYKTLEGISIYIDERNCLLISAPKLSDTIIKTNDIVELISDQHFEWLGRYDNVINSGGVKLFPEQIEEKLSKIIHSRFFVMGVPDTILGQKLVLIIEGESQTIDISTTDLSKYEVPKHIYFIKQFIETDTKKIQREKTFNLITI